MANSRLLNDIQSHLSKLEQEYNALSQAYQIIAASESDSGKAPKISNLKSLIGSTGTGKKRGRKPGSTNAAKAAKDTGRVRKGSNIDPETGKRRRVPGLSGVIQETLKKQGKFMTNTEITNKLSSNYPAKTKPELSRYLSIILSNMKADGTLNSYKFDKQGNPTRHGYWGLANWFDGTKPKSEFGK